MIIEEIKKIHNKPADIHFPIIDLIRKRWSPRAFSNEEVHHDELASLFEAARWAPSSNNLQPWRFIYTRKGSEAWDKMFDCLSEFNQKWVGNAPVLVLSIIKKTTPDGKDNYHALHDLGLAVGNLSIQAQSMNIAIHQMAGVNWKKAEKVFKIPDDFHVATAIAIGKYGGNLDSLPEDLKETELKRRKRKRLSSIVSKGEWKKHF